MLTLQGQIQGGIEGEPTHPWICPSLMTGLHRKRVQVLVAENTDCIMYNKFLKSSTMISIITNLIGNTVAGEV